MNFDERLNYYIDAIGCTAKELSDASGVSNSVICRYRKGDRIPKYQSEQFDNIVNGIYSLAKIYSMDFSYDAIYQDFKESLDPSFVQPDIFRERFNLLISTLHINVSDLSKYMGFDSSYLSKIRTGNRVPHHLNDFIKSIVKYIVDNYHDVTSREKISSIIFCDINSLNKKEDYYILLEQWIGGEGIKKEDKGLQSFLYKLDEFELNDYIKSIHFDKIKVPTTPIMIPKSKNYYGISGFKNSQIDVLKAIVLSKARDDVFFYSNMSILDVSDDEEFTKKFMFGLALILKKGLHFHIIHDLDRSWDELMMGLEGWIPLYMTGQIHPYYFKDNSNLIFSNMLCVGGSAALYGSVLTEYMNLAKFYVTNKKEEVNYYKDNAKILLKKANKLMEIYNEERKELFFDFLCRCDDIRGKRKNIYYNLPIYVISDSLLERIILENNISSQDRESIFEYVKKEKSRIFKILENNVILDEITVISKEEFEIHPCSLSLSNMFYPKKIVYTYDEYLEYVNLIKEFNNSNYSFKINKNSIFKNINISIIEGVQVIISKENQPSIHFVIHHPKLVEAIEKFEMVLD